MAKGISGGVDIINTLHQKNDADFYIAWAEDIKYDDQKSLKEEIDEIVSSASDSTIRVHKETTISSNYWGSRVYGSGSMYSTNVAYIEIEGFDNSNNAIIVIPSVLSNNTNNKNNLKTIMEAKIDVIISNNDTILSRSNYDGEVTLDIDKKGIFLICNGTIPTTNIYVDIIEIPLTSN